METVVGPIWFWMRSTPGLNVFHGPPACGKTTVADLVSHALYGRRIATAETSESIIAPEGELVVESRGRRFRLRRSHDEVAGERLTVAALDHSTVDQDTVRQLVSDVSPSLSRPLFAVSFRESPRFDWLLSDEFAREFSATLRRLKWAPPTVQPELRPIYARLRALETEVAALVRGLGSEESRAAAAAKSQARSRNRRASYFLAQLTDGELLRLRLGGSAGGPHVVSRAGDSLALDSLWSDAARPGVFESLPGADVGAGPARCPAAAGARRAVCEARRAIVGRAGGGARRLLPPRTPSAGVHCPARSGGAICRIECANA